MILVVLQRSLPLIAKILTGEEKHLIVYWLNLILLNFSFIHIFMQLFWINEGMSLHVPTPVADIKTTHEHYTLIYNN